MNWRVLLRRPPVPVVAQRPPTSATGPSADPEQVLRVKVDTGAPPPAPPGNPYLPATTQLRDVAKWLIAAFAAVATVMLAGTQLSSLGKLSTDHPTRLAVAAVAASVVVLATARSIYLLSTVLPFDVSGMQGLLESAREQPMRGIVEADSGMRAGRSSVAHLLADYRVARSAQRVAMVLRAGLQREEAEHAEPPPELRARLDHARRLEKVADAEVQALRGPVQALIQLKGYLRVRAQFDDVRGGVMALAVLAAAGIIAFAWAANPPEPKASASAVLQPRPVAALLVLTAAGEQDLAGIVGEECARTAHDRGVPVVALSADAATGRSEVVILTGAGCATNRLTVDSRTGRVLPVDAVGQPAAPRG